MPGPTAEPGGPDEFERRIREITGDISGPGVIREPSAAERTRQTARKSGWRNARKARKLREPVPEPRRGPRPPRGPQPPRGPRPSKRGSIRSMVLAVVVLACVAGAVVAIIKVAKHSPNAAFGDNTPVTKGATPALPTPAAASSLPSPTVAAPFLGTPAQSYADGAAGIVIPHARAVGSYSAAEVAAAYRETRGLLIAANLSPPTLAGGAPNAFASMLIRQQRSFFVDRLNHIGLSHGIQKSTRTWVTSFAPGTTQLVGDVIKVHGTMRATAGKNGSYSVLQITGDYLFVYAVERPDQPSTLMRVVVRYTVDDDFAAYDDPGGALEPWWASEGAVSGELCGINDGFVHPDFPNASEKVRPTGAAVNPYDQNTPVQVHGGCRPSTGT